MHTIDNPIVEVKNLSKTFDPKHKPVIYAVHDVSLAVRRGEILGLVGESGCGKSTLAKLMLRLEMPSRGSVFFHGEDITRYRFGQMRRLRDRMQMMFQSVSTAFNPYYTVRRSIEEPLENYRTKFSKAERLERSITLLRQVGLDHQYLNRYPNELSGGQRQRVGIARALVLQPDFVVCDESVSSVDHAVKNQILDLLVHLQKQHGCTYLFISHDLATVQKICDRVAVMYLGNLVEILPATTMQPRHPYTRALMAASLSSDPRQRTSQTVLFKPDEESYGSPHGCPFHNRCLFARERCKAIRPQLTDRGDGHMVACHCDQVYSIKETA